MTKLVTKACATLIGVFTSNRYLASEYHTLSEELALQQMTEASAHTMEQINSYQNLMIVIPLFILIGGAIWMKNDIIDFMEEL